MSDISKNETTTKTMLNPSSFMNYAAKLYLKSDKSRHYLTKNNKSRLFFFKDYIIIADYYYL